ncbi:hypothetical protein THRCLA_20932 [Thraustotheca clavata]|uniref:PDZ domain-containing protein n=1 Tax=Thraustotheca clavata TaxID=74557 RepID=A0A1W0A1U8_9STRA|nr:hypothetical protein THRCLA_20932 [Thraustotheca clavata]
MSIHELTENGTWSALELLVESNPELVRDEDQQGNLPLHLACENPQIPLFVLEKLVYAYPDALWMRNHDKLLPIEIAFHPRHKLPQEHLEFLSIYSPLPDQEENNIDHENQPNLKNVRQALLGRSSSFVGTHSIADDFADNLPDLMNQLQLLLNKVETQSHIYQELNSGRLCFQQYPMVMEHEAEDFDNVDLSGSGCDYFVIWKKGELGIRLKQSSIQVKTGGCRVERITQGRGVAIGITMVRLGDLLVVVNGENVEHLPFGKIVKLIQTASKPVRLGFRTPTKIEDDHKPQQRLSDRNSTEWSRASNSTEWTRASTLGSRPSSLSGGFEPASQNRSIDEWSEIQANVHNEVVMLLSDTLARCELLKQELEAN